MNEQFTITGNREMLDEIAGVIDIMNEEINKAKGRKDLEMCRPLSFIRYHIEENSNSFAPISLYPTLYADSSHVTTFFVLGARTHHIIQKYLLNKKING